MKALPRNLLIVSLIAGAIGLVVTIAPLNLAPAWALALPTAAICFGLFLIALVLQNEMAKFDQETRKSEPDNVPAAKAPAAVPSFERA